MKTLKTIDNSRAMSINGGAWCTECRCSVGDSYSAKAWHVLTRHTKEVAMMTGSMYLQVRKVLHRLGIPCL